MAELALKSLSFGTLTDVEDFALVFVNEYCKVLMGEYQGDVINVIDAEPQQKFDCGLPQLKFSDGLIVSGLGNISKWIVQLWQDVSVPFETDCFLRLFGFKTNSLSAVNKWTLFCEVQLQKVIGKLNEKKENFNQEASIELLQLEQKLFGSKFIAGNEITLADLLIFCYVHKIIENLDLYHFSRISLWYLEISQLKEIEETCKIVGITLKKFPPPPLQQQLKTKLSKEELSKNQRRRKSKHQLPKIQEKFNQSNIYPNYTPLTNQKIDWDNAPTFIDPIAGELSDGRAQRKREQIENIFNGVQQIVHDGDIIVDFCSGGGHVGIVLAYFFPKCHVIMIDSKLESIQRARQRISQGNLKNTTLIQSNIEYFISSFNIGVSLHSCGVATDLILEICIKNSASFVLCPCCFGALHHVKQVSHISQSLIENENPSQNSQDSQDLQKKLIVSSITYPRSSIFRQIIDDEEYFAMGNGAERTEWDFTSVNAISAKKFMGFIDLDRILYAQEFGYEAFVSTLEPFECSPKNDLIFGFKVK